MKKIYVGMLALFSVSLVLFISCRKNTVAENGAVVLTAEALSKDAGFISLNDAINRFDPNYLVLVYRDTRTVPQLIAAGNDLLIQLKTDPGNRQYQQQLADHYRFSSVEELKQYSDRITSSMQQLDARYDFNKTLFVAKGGQLYYKARLFYIKDKLASRQAVKRTDGSERKPQLWQEFVDAYYSNFGDLVYSSPGNESLEDGVESGGGGCGGEVCCDRYEICKMEATNNLLINMAALVVSGAVGGGKIGGVAGSGVPGLGNAAGAVIGGIFGGIGGTMIAYARYSNDISICRAKYQLCLDEKKNKS